MGTLVSTHHFYPPLIALTLSACVQGPTGGGSNAELEARLEELEGRLAAVEEDGDEGGLEARVAELEALRAEVDDLTNIVDGIAAGTVTVLNTGLTLHVPDDYADVNEALRELDRYVIGTDGSATIKIADGTYTYLSSIEVKHANGDRIAIVGNEDNAARVVLEFQGTTGIIIRNNNTLGQINGVTLVGDGSVGATGVIAEKGGVIIIDPGVEVKDFGDDGIEANNLGLIYADGTRAINNGRYGYVAFNHSYIRAGEALSRENESSGFRAENGSSIFARSAESQQNGGSGFVSTNESFLYAETATSTDNTTNGYNAGHGGYLYALSSSASGNGGEAWSPAGDTEGNEQGYMDR